MAASWRAEGKGGAGACARAAPSGEASSCAQQRLARRGQQGARACMSHAWVGQGGARVQEARRAAGSGGARPSSVAAWSGRAPCVRAHGQAERGSRVGVESAAGRSRRRAAFGAHARERSRGEGGSGRRKEGEEKKKGKRKWKMEKKEKEGRERGKKRGGVGIRAAISAPGRPRAASGMRAWSGATRGSRANRERAGVGNRTQEKIFRDKGFGV